MTAQLPSKVRLAQIASFSKSMALPPSHDEIEAMARALLAAHEQEPVGHVIQQLRGYESPTYVVQMTNEPEDGDEVFSHPAPVPAVPDEIDIKQAYQYMRSNSLAGCYRDGWNDRAALQSGNSAQPEPVNKTYKLPPNSFSDDELMGMAHGDNPVANAYRELLEFRRNAAGGDSAQPVTVPAGYVLVPVEPTPEILATITEAIKVMRGSSATYSRVLAAAPKAPGDQLAPAPEDRLQKAIVDACMVFLHGCGNGYKNHEGHFYDVETEYSFCIWEIAEQIGVVKETGNYKWSLCKEMEDDIEEVYRKYAMRIMEAAPKVKS